MRISLKEYCEEQGREDLLIQWDAEANLPFTPETVTRGSSRNIWWICDKGHTWQATPYARTANRTGCPVCAGKKVVPLENDLATRCPEVAAEWNDSKNGDLRPETVSPNSHRKVWWKCRKCGYEWVAEIKSRAGINKSGCPCCADKTVVPGTNDFATKYPLLVSEWHPSKNEALKPCDVLPGTDKKVWWQCKHGHEWQAEISSRARGAGCPICAGRAVVPGENDLGSVRPRIATEWHPTKNGLLRPENVTVYSNRKAWWICKEGHEYAAVISRRVSGSGCPYCANRKVLTGYNDLATKYPNVAKEWHPTKNDILPQDVIPGSRKRVWWICQQGHEYEASIQSRTSQHTGCPICANRVIIPEENSLAVLFPQIAAEWNYERNGDLLPENLSAGNNRTVWWRCSLGHEWQAAINTRTSKNSGCPICMNRKVLPGFNDLATTHPKIAAQWHPTLNGKYTPQMFTYGSMRKVWWICADGHVWKAPISRRAGTQKSGCPVCNGRMRKSQQRYLENVLLNIQEETKTVEVNPLKNEGGQLRKKSM